MVLGDNIFYWRSGRIVKEIEQRFKDGVVFFHVHDPGATACGGI
jgi:dTDP-glucose pyrophosphorylase